MNHDLSCLANILLVTLLDVKMCILLVTLLWCENVQKEYQTFSAVTQPSSRWLELKSYKNGQWKIILLTQQLCSVCLYSVKNNMLEMNIWVKVGLELITSWSWIMSSGTSPGCYFSQHSFSNFIWKCAEMKDVCNKQTNKPNKTISLCSDTNRLYKWTMKGITCECVKMISFPKTTVTWFHKTMVLKLNCVNRIWDFVPSDVHTLKSGKKWLDVTYLWRLPDWNLRSKSWTWLNITSAFLLYKDFPNLA